MVFLILLFLLQLDFIETRWTKPNIYVWLEQNSYICYLELNSPHDLRFLYKEEAERWKCSCGDPLWTQSACARSSNLKRPFCARLPDLCMKAYSIIFKPSVNNFKLHTTLPPKKAIVSTGKKLLFPVVPKKDEFFTLAPKFDPVVDSKALQQDDRVIVLDKKKELEIANKTISITNRRPVTTIKSSPLAPTTPPTASPSNKPIIVPSTTKSTIIPSTTKLTTTATLAPVPTTKSNHLLDGEVSLQKQEKKQEGIEIFFNNTEAMNRLMDIIIKRIVESGRSSNNTALKNLNAAEVQHSNIHRKENRRQMIKMLSSHEEQAPDQKIVFTEVMQFPQASEKESHDNETLVLRPLHNFTASPSTVSSIPFTTSAAIKTTTTTGPLILSAPVTSIPIRITKTKQPRRGRTQFHEKLVRIQKQLLQILGEKFDDFDDDDINDNDIITIFREHMNDEEEERHGKELAFSDDDSLQDKWSEEDENAKDENKKLFKETPFNPRVCEDNHPLCELWSFYKRCHSHAGYMYKYCRKSCGICE